MLNNNPFYHSTFRNITAAFGALFNDISIIRFFQDTKIKKCTFALGDSILNVDSTTNFLIGSIVTGSGIDPNTTIVSIAPTTVTLSNPTNIQKTNSSITVVTNQSQTVKVPLQFASRDKAWERRIKDPDSSLGPKTTFPRMAFNITAVDYDQERKIVQSQYIAKQSNVTGRAVKMFQPAPYSIGFELYVACNNIEDGFQIIEQILPYFNPEFTITTKSMPSLGLTKDVPIILNSTQFSDNTVDSDFIESRIMEWTLSFTVKTYMYGPSDSTGPIIKHIETPFYFDPLMVAGNHEAKINIDTTKNTPDGAGITTTIITENSPRK